MERLGVVEILSPRGEPLARVGVGRTFRIGRGFGCDVILDDPYADAVHLQGTVTEEGHFEVRDVSKVNPATLDGTPVGREPRRVEDGALLTVGATPLRLRHASTPVPAALPLRESTRPAGASRVAAGPVAWALAALASIAVAVEGWLSTPIDYNGADAVAAMIAGFLLVLIWAGGWALGTRAVTGRFRFRAHLATVGALILALLPGTYVSSAASFAAGPGVQAVVGVLTAVGIAWLVLYAHSRVASSGSRRRVAAITGGVVLGLGVAFYALAATVEDPTGALTGSLLELRAIPNALVAAEAPAGYVAGLEGLVEELADMEP